MRTFIALTAFNCLNAVSTGTNFEKWTLEHGKSYSSNAEKVEREAIYHQNLDKIDEINSRNAGWTAGISKFTDMTWEEFQHFYTMKAGQNCSATEINGPKILAQRTLKEKAPHHFDWRHMDAVTKVKDQGQCGSCWSFSTTGNVESGQIIHDREHHHILLSEQQLVDCAQAFNNNGCGGGLPSQAFEYIHAAPGLMSEADYPYTAKDGNCTFDPTKAKVNVLTSVNMTAGDEIMMREALLAFQPISIAFEVVDDFMHYKNGTYSSTVCKNGPSDVNHAVLAVGFGTDDSEVDYWTVKNSWSESWGNHGYFNIQRGVNMCGLAQCSSFALIDTEPRTSHIV